MSRDVHKVAPEVNTRVKCDVCGVGLSSLEEYVTHHIATHEFVAEYVQRTFLNDKAFDQRLKDKLSHLDVVRTFRYVDDYLILLGKVPRERVQGVAKGVLEVFNRHSSGLKFAHGMPVENEIQFLELRLRVVLSGAMSLIGRFTLVTSGASGIMEATCHALASEAATWVVVDKQLGGHRENGCNLARSVVKVRLF
ncbi:hypothetical protein MRX96_003221 [Rhipicephalus microplus]